MKFKLVLLLFLSFSSRVFAAQVDCRNLNSCIQAESIIEFGKVSLKSVKEEWKTYSWGDKYREITLTVSAYFPTLLYGKPIVGQEFNGNGQTIFIMAPMSDLDSSSSVINQFVIHAGKEKVKVSFYDGSLSEKQLVFLGEF